MNDQYPPPATARPTRVHWWIVGFATLISVLLYLDRLCISLAELYIKQDLGLSDEQIGVMLGAFFWTYALAQVPSGWLTDRFGARVMLTIYIVSWSAFTGLTGLAGSFAGLLALRFAFGIAQAGAYPTCAAMLSRWVPLSSRGLASSLVAAGGRTGGVLAPIATALLIVAFVPASESSLLVPADLMNVPLLQQRLAAVQDGSRGNSTPPSALDRWLWQRLSSRSREGIAGGTAGSSGAEATVASLVDDLNRALSDPALSKVAAAAPATLPREATRLLERDPAALPSHELQRLNRLVLETAYPAVFRRLYVRGWRPVMWAYGALGIPLALGFYWIFRNSPAEHPACNEAEQAWLAEGKPAQQSGGGRTVSGVPLRALLTNRSMWLNCVMQFTTNCGWVFLVTWLPRYLENQHAVPVEQRALMASIPVLVGFVGMVLGGQLTDFMHRRFGLRWSRALPMGASRLVAMVAYLLCLFDPGPWTAIALFSVVAFGTDLGVAATWAYAQDVGGRHVGSVLGWGNMFGNFGAAVMPSLFIAIVGESAAKNWPAGFAACAIAFAISAIAGFAIDARETVD